MAKKKLVWKICFPYSTGTLSWNMPYAFWQGIKLTATWYVVEKNDIHLHELALHPYIDHYPKEKRLKSLYHEMTAFATSTPDNFKQHSFLFITKNGDLTFNFFSLFGKHFRTGLGLFIWSTLFVINNLLYDHIVILLIFFSFQ